VVGAIIGPFCAKFINVSQWGGESEADVGEIAYVSIRQGQIPIPIPISELITTGLESNGDWYRDGQSWLRITKTIPSASPSGAHHMLAAFDDHPMADHFGMYQVNDSSVELCE
jgi:hypothetical protein